MPATPPLRSSPPPWWSEFHSFTMDHAIALAWTIGLVIAACFLGRRWRRDGTPEGAERERQLCAAWGGFIICYNCWYLFYWFSPEHFDVRQSLPCQMCDIAALLAPLLFLTRWRTVRTLMYFWGLGLSTQAFISPILKQGIGVDRYWLFWIGHLAIVGSAVYDLVVRRYRPTFRDFLSVVAITLVWYGSMGALNMALGGGANYGYNGDTTPDRPTIIDHLGPWPYRAILLVPIVIVLFAAMWGVWPLTERMRTGRRSS